MTDSHVWVACVGGMLLSATGNNLLDKLVICRLGMSVEGVYFCYVLHNFFHASTGVPHFV